MTTFAALSDRALVACRGRIVELIEHVSRQGLPWVSGVVESSSGADRFEIWPVPFRTAPALKVGMRVVFVAVVELRDAEPKLLVQHAELLP